MKYELTIKKSAAKALESLSVKIVKPLSYTAAVEAANNSSVTHSTSSGETITISGFETEVVVSKDEVRGGKLPSTLKAQFMHGFDNNIWGNGKFNSIRINEDIINKFDANSGAEAFVHVLVHFLGRRGQGGTNLLPVIQGASIPTLVGKRVTYR